MIHIKNLSNNWGDFTLKNISLDIKESEYFVILGPTGAGKTLLLEIIAGLYFPKEGKVMINGNDVTFTSPENRGLGFVYQDYALFPHLNVKKNIEYGLKLRKVPEDKREEKISELVKMLKINHLLHRNTETLSGGEKQKVALARALAINPKIILMDEPFSALDENTKSKLILDMKELHKTEGITFVHVTHSQEEAILLADRIGIMMKGTIVQVGNPDEIFYKPVTKEIAQFVKIENIWEGKVTNKKEDEMIVEVNGNKIVALSDHFKVGQDVRLIIRPEDIILGKGDTSARNNFKGKITSVIKHGFYYIIRIDCGFEVEAAVTKQSIENLNIREGKDINIFFKATALQVIKR
ncbi:MAG: Trehalose/maltose import ATP-binding protein MalK [Candidatus Methanofastidiosum methylothiophilum]|uniref:Molybdate/tungstate import ATP-binding protein WtpC n=1 Tax=Candidatus Methanofastidiosum methylothiophilum TaxID=1705564 RepID=A0A150J623_9EURY|nr:MAG: Trehalose/maltose import ATP-binding protein MalK [Candidatus Methanofastidiosum methylthiophilus]